MCAYLLADTSTPSGFILKRVLKHRMALLAVVCLDAKKRPTLAGRTLAYRQVPLRGQVTGCLNSPLLLNPAMFQTNSHPQFDCKQAPALFIFLKKVVGKYDSLQAMAVFDGAIRHSQVDLG